MKKLVILFLLGLYSLTSIAQEADKILGVWWNDEKTSKIFSALCNKSKASVYFSNFIYYITNSFSS